VFRKFILLSAASLILSSAPAHAGKFIVSYESEAPGIQNTTATVAGGTETFTSKSNGSGQTFTSDFGTGGKYTGTYKNVQINSADQYGGAGGNGQYAVTFNSTGYSLDLSTKQPGGVTYFGYWLSALDPGNEVSFYSKGKLLFDFKPSDVIAAIKSTANPSAYYGNPNSPYKGWNSSEPYAYLNFFATGNTTFDKVVFKEVNYYGGYESDNHTIGKWSTLGTGTAVKLISSVSAVPENSTWIMLIAGMGMVAATMRRRKAPLALAA